MQHNITGCDTMLLSETIRLLTLGSQPRGEGPKALRINECYLAVLPHQCAPRIQCYRRVVRSAMLDLKPLPLWGVPFSLSQTLGSLFVTHPGIIRAY